MLRRIRLCNLNIAHDGSFKNPVRPHYLEGTILIRCHEHAAFRMLLPKLKLKVVDVCCAFLLIANDS